MNNPKPNLTCFCCSQKTFAQCCEPILNGTKIATTPEQLMRSRYSAFCTKNTDYLIATVHPNYRHLYSQKNLESSMAATRWLGLKVIKTKLSGITGSVEFCAFHQDASATQPKALDDGYVMQLHEDSEFKWVDNHWFYCEGKHLPNIKLGRNDNCYCASGLKYKRCCGK